MIYHSWVLGYVSCSSLAVGFNRLSMLSTIRWLPLHRALATSRYPEQSHPVIDSPMKIRQKSLQR